MAETAASLPFSSFCTSAHLALFSFSFSFSVFPPLNVSLFLSFSLSLHTLFLSPRSPLISRRHVGGGDDSGTEMEQLESGGSLCLSPSLLPFSIPVVSSLCLRPSTDHRCTPPVSDHFPSSASLPRPIRSSGTSEVDRVTRAHEYITNGNRGETLFSMKNSPPLL